MLSGMAYRAVPEGSEAGGPDAIVDRFVGLHRVLYASPLGALDAETERLGAMVRAASADIAEDTVERQATRVRDWARAEFRAPLATHFDTLAMLGAWILRDGRSLEELHGCWRESERQLRDTTGASDADPTLVAAFVVAGIHGEFELDETYLQRCGALYEHLSPRDPTHQAPWFLATSALLALRSESPETIVEWVDEARELFRERTRGRGGFADEAVQLACLSGLRADEAVDRMMLLRSTPLLPLEPLEAGALCQISLDADRINGAIRGLVQRLSPFAARGRHEAIRMAVAATLMGVEDPVCRATADVVSYIRVSARRIDRARRGGFLQ